MPWLPSISVLLPVLDEVDTIDRCLDTLSVQDYGGSVEILVADGGSTDGTLARLRDRAQADPQLRIIENPRRRQSYGLNLLANKAKGEVLVRADAHTTYEPHYISHSVNALATSEAVAAGGLMHPVGTSKFGVAVAAAMQSRLAIGPGKFHHATERQFVDTVYLGAFRRDDFLIIDGYRHFPSGVAEDADLYFRWRRDGRRILLDPGIQSYYSPRDTPRTLFRQFFNYGRGKADMLLLNRRWPSWRPLAPLLLVLALAYSLLWGVVSRNFLAFIWLVGFWLVVLALAGRTVRSPGDRIRVILAAGIMHVSYGIGLLVGLIWRPRPQPIITTANDNTNPGL